MTGGRTAGILCPSCNHDDMSILKWIKDGEGILIGMRLLCMKCEHPWDYWMDVYGDC